MRVRVAATALTFWLTSAAYTVAMAQYTSGPPGKGSGPPTHAAPEIDGPAGVAAIALLVSVGMIAYRRYKQK